MERQRSLLSPVLALSGLALFGFSTWMAVAELSPPLGLATSEGGKIAAFASGQSGLPLAEGSQARQLEACSTLAGTVYARSQRTEWRERLLNACHDQALEAVGRAPTMGVGWLVAARFAAELGQFDAFNDNLVMAQRVAPQEQWLAERRVQLVEDNYSKANAALRDAELSDLAILVLSERGIGTIARRYVDEPAFRERITQVVETLPPAEQQRFVDFVKRAARVQTL